MIKRIAYFEGQIHPGKEEAFFAFVTERMIPIWTRFPTARRVEVLRSVSSDDGAHSYPPVLQITYADLAAVEATLASPVRDEGRLATQELLKLFDGRVFHINFELADFAGPAAA